MSDAWSCWCSTALRSDPPIDSIDESKCDIACPPGNSGESCGGHLRLNIYTNNKPFVDPAPADPAPKGWKVAGCYANFGANDSPTFPATDDNFMNATTCTKMCKSTKNVDITYAGVYSDDVAGDSCVCGTAANFKMALPVDLKLCLTPCKGQLPGEPKEACGSVRNAVVYQVSGLSFVSAHKLCALWIHFSLYNPHILNTVKLRNTNHFDLLILFHDVNTTA